MNFDFGQPAYALQAPAKPRKGANQMTHGDSRIPLMFFKGP